ncbi:MAG: TonB-dependent receptor [Cyanobacteria bacterium P01_H01_bin.105]
MPKFSVALTLLSCLLALPAWAGEEPNSAPPKSLAQLADVDDIIRINVIESILDQPVYSPFRREGTVREATQPVYVINREQIEAQGARTVDEALLYLPGVLSEGTAGGQLGAQSGQLIRGSGSAQTLILLDGRPINEVGGFGAFDLSNFTTDAVEQIEVLPGSGSVLYGSNAIGGVINIITRRPLEKVGVEATTSFDVGSFGYNSQVLQVRGNTGNVDWMLGYNRTEAENDFPFDLTTTDFDDTRTNAEVLYNNLNFQLAADIDERNRIRLGALYLTKDLEVPGGVPVPGSISGGFNALTDDDSQYTENLLLDFTYEAKLGQSDNSLLTARVFGDFLDSTFSDPVADSIFDSPSEDKVNQTSLGSQLQHAWQFADNQNITYGVDYRNVQAENETVDLLTDVVTDNYDDSINQTGIFARYQADVTPRFGFNAGVRQDFNDLADGSFTSFSLGTRIALTDTTSLRANFARNFRVPTLADLFFSPFNNPDLEPETSLGFDVGIDQQIGDRGLFRFTFYRNEVDDAISFDLTTFTPQNIGQVESIGIETELNYRVFDQVFAFANYTWNRPEIKDGPNPDDNGNSVPFTHADSFNLGVAYEPGDGLYAALFLHSISDVFVDRGNLESLDGRTTVDFKVRLPLSDRWALNASIDNIFDEQFEEFPGFPGVGRSVQIGLRGAF